MSVRISCEVLEVSECGSDEWEIKWQSVKSLEEVSCCMYFGLQVPAADGWETRGNIRYTDNESGASGVRNSDVCAE